MIPASKPYTTTEMAYVSDKDSGIGMQKLLDFDDGQQEPRSRIRTPLPIPFPSYFLVNMTAKPETKIIWVRNTSPI